MAPPIIKRFLISFNQYKLLGLLAFLLSLGGAVVLAIQPDPERPPRVYKAIGQLAFQTPPPAFTSTGTQIQEQGRTISKDILISPKVLLGTAERLRLSQERILDIRDKKLIITFPDDKAATDPNQPQPQQAQQDSQPQVITLEVTDSTLEGAKLLLETFMEEMVNYSRLLNSSQLTARIDALKQRLGTVQKDLTAAEENFYRYISKQGSDLLAVQDGSLFSAITSSQQRQREIRLTLQEIEGQIGSLTTQLGLSPKQAYTSAALSADPIIANLRARILETELQLERLQKDLRPEHPALVKLNKDKQVNETLLQQRAQEVIGKDGIFTTLPSQVRQESNLDPTRQQLASQLVSLQTQKEGLIKQLDSLVTQERQLRNQYERFPEQQLQQARLVQAVEFQRVIYQNILTALVDAQSAEAETVGSLTIAQRPIANEVIYPPNNRNRLLILLAGAGLGVLAGTGLIFLLAAIDDRLHTPQELREALISRQILLLGELPTIGKERSPILADGDPDYLAFYERFRSKIRRLGSETSKVVIITSITNEEGKTLTAYNLAIAASLAGRRTLLIEADLRSPSVATNIQVLPDPEAQNEPLLYYGARSKSIRLAPSIENLSILPSPGPQRQAAAILESSELQLLLKDARGRFDMVVIDTPSLSRCNDALLLEPLTDGLIIVTQPGLTRSSLLNEALDQLAEAEVSILGAVINNVENLATPANAQGDEAVQPQFAQLNQPSTTEEEDAKVEV
ncbi:polysaccharide biosynthesis tyrosine autokinase [Chroococcus sp. FPU101]|uniref:GumC family protein n=1 Tax=Chroococcus sp. FPU101 TaxID=1974212 RepID=UPI001A905DE4|nr:polysaccharide biosynthesis tyrosine autokinase [Chroococcus sp. FPU101]GFE68246.1 lipopolysaccharide biosynthesis [Chroococcus sp. FPU101]